MARASSLEPYMIDSLKDSTDEFLDDLPDEYIVTVFSGQKSGKKGVFPYEDGREIKMLIRSAEEARRNDIIIGIVLKGDYVGTASGTEKFRAGDIIVRADEKRFEVNDSKLTLGGSKRVVDLSARDTGDPGDLQ